MTKKEVLKIKAELRAEQKKKKLKKTDGLGPLEIKKIRSALRLVWQRSHARKLVVERCTDADGFTRCEKCAERTPSLKVDHIEKVGDLDAGFIRRLFIDSNGLQGLCRVCHNEKTKNERREGKRRKAKNDWGF
jgi:hypothetical protein